VTDERDFNRRMVRTVLTVVAVAVLLATLWEARDALMLIYVSALIAMGFSPLVRVIERPRKAGGRRRVPRVFAILVIYVAIVGVIVLIGFIVLPPLIDQASALWSNLPQYFNRFQNLLVRYKLVARRVTLEEAVQNAPAGSGSNAVGTVLFALWGVAGGLFGIITVLILSFYLLIEAESLFKYITRFVPEARRAHFTTASREAVSKVSAWLRAQLILAGVMGTFAAVGLYWMGEPYFYVVALIAAIGETIPIVGPIIGGVTAVAVAITVSPILALKVGLYFLVLHQLEANVLVPKIMERRVGVSPVTVMTALLIGGALWGLIGAILAIPTAAILSVIVEELTTETDSPIVSA
jgi:predicted PurR-regulated permease PerM